MPPRTLISVDLPAPFSPTSAWISPEWRSKETRSSASTPGKRLEMSRISRRAGLRPAAVGRPARLPSSPGETPGDCGRDARSPLLAIDLLMRVVTVFDDGGVDVALVDDDRGDQDGWNVFLPVVDLVVGLDRLL